MQQPIKNMVIRVVNLAEKARSISELHSYTLLARMNNYDFKLVIAKREFVCHRHYEIDATFSIDGVIGTFAFTLAVPLIPIGNGLGAVVVRELTIRNIERIKCYRYLKNGAMYSILFLGTIMVLDSFGFHIPAWLSPVITFVIVGYSLYRSVKCQIGDAAAT
jgi:hypothetical protein